MAICFFSQSETHREFSNFAPFGIDLGDMRWPSVEHYYQAHSRGVANSECGVANSE
jgi:predicted NAD-dependent protein-ADP-ribosyltransferase YbiA (DUF1768 family)